MTTPALGVCYYPEHWPEDLWERDAARHRDTPYGQQLSQHIAHIRQISGQ